MMSSTRLLVREDRLRHAMAWGVVFAVSWAVLEFVLGPALRAPYHLLQIVWCRYAIHLGIILVFWGWRNPKTVLFTSRPCFHICRSLMMIIMPGAFTLAMQRNVSPEFIFSVFWIAPALIIALARLFLAELPPISAVAVMVVGAGAAASIFGHWHSSSIEALCLALTVTVSFSIYVVMTRSLRNEALEANLFYTAIGPFVAFSPLMTRVWIWPEPRDAIILSAIGIVGFGALWALDHACRIAPVWSSTGGFFVQPLFYAAIVAAVEGVRTSPRVVLSMTLILAAMGILWLRAKKFD